MTIVVPLMILAALYTLAAAPAVALFGVRLIVPAIVVALALPAAAQAPPAAGIAKPSAPALPIPALVETPTLSRTHRNLPPVAERVPAEPLVVDLAAKDRVAGVHGGDVDTFIGRSKDIRLINVWGYARLVAFDTNLNLVPDILRAVDDEGGRRFTLHLRRGHRWSDGHPFTAEDFRYYFEDVLSNTDLTPTPDPFMTVDGALPTFEVIDDVTVRYIWAAPNARFLPLLAAARDPFIYRPAHYLKQFHASYGDEAEIAAAVTAARVRSWARLHNDRDDMYNATNPDLPSLQPWVVTAGNSDRRHVMVRNPYFHRVTTGGQQLPYIDKFVMHVVEDGLIATKVQAGEADLQARGLAFADLPVLKRGEATKGYRTRLWPQANASAIALYPNLTAKDRTLRALFRDRRFREALSLGVDRTLVSRVLYFGLAEPSANIILDRAPLFEEGLEGITDYDPARANALLDEMGLVERDSGGVRLMPDGRPLELIAETSGENQIEIDALELIKDTWAEIGIRLYARPTQRDVLRNRAMSGDLALGVWLGYDNGLPTAATPPDERTPVSVDFLTGPAWGAYVMSGGTSGEVADYPPAAALLDLQKRWLKSADEADRAAIWAQILRIHAEEVLTIGTVQGVVQPIAVSEKLRNVPEVALYGWDPGANFGLYRPDEFFFEGGE